MVFKSKKLTAEDWAGIRMICVLLLGIISELLLFWTLFFMFPISSDIKEIIWRIICMAFLGFYIALITLDGIRYFGKF